MLGLFKSGKSPSTDPTDPPPAEARPPGWLDRLRAGLAKTRGLFNTPITDLVRRHAQIDEAIYEELEEILLTADVGVDATRHLLDVLRQRVKRERLEDAGQLRDALKALVTELLAPLERPLDVSTARPFVIMLVGVNGAGKTTTIGKLAKRFRTDGRRVLLAAGDTFRAAAREQLSAWGERNGVEVIAGQGGDPAAVIFDAVQSARARGIDVVLADTAGRLPTQTHLMEEIKKVRRVIQKADPSAPHEVLLVLDANVGQNALTQVKAFHAAVGVSGLVLAKLDGTAKGGVIAALAQCGQGSGLGIPVRYLGVGEGLDDLTPFVAGEFVEALFG